MNIQAAVRHVVNVLSRHEPDDFADLPLGKMPGKARERIGIDLFLLRQLGRVIQRSAFGLGEQAARPVLSQRVEFCLINAYFIMVSVVFVVVCAAEFLRLSQTMTCGEHPFRHFGELFAVA